MTVAVGMAMTITRNFDWLPVAIARGDGLWLLNGIADSVPVAISAGIAHRQIQLLGYGLRQVMFDQCTRYRIRHRNDALWPHSHRTRTTDALQLLNNQLEHFHTVLRCSRPQLQREHPPQTFRVGL